MSEWKDHYGSLRIEVEPARLSLKAALDEQIVGVQENFARQFESAIDGFDWDAEVQRQAHAMFKEQIKRAFNNWEVQKAIMQTVVASLQEKLNE